MALDNVSGTLKKENEKWFLNATDLEGLLVHFKGKVIEIRAI